MIIAVREATVGPLLGLMLVSTGAMLTSSYSNPSVSAAIWQRMVLVPWPNSVLDTSTRRPPVAAASTPDQRIEIAFP